MAMYTVRTKEGELGYASFGDIQKAYAQGLIEADDEIREEGQTAWRKAGAHPWLKDLKPERKSFWATAENRLVLIMVVLSAVALYFIARGRYLMGLIPAVVAATLLFQLTTGRLLKRKKGG